MELVNVRTWQTRNRVKTEFGKNGKRKNGNKLINDSLMAQSEYATSSCHGIIKAIFKLLNRILTADPSDVIRRGQVPEKYLYILSICISRFGVATHLVPNKSSLFDHIEIAFFLPHFLHLTMLQIGLQTWHKKINIFLNIKWE